MDSIVADDGFSSSFTSFTFPFLVPLILAVTALILAVSPHGEQGSHGKLIAFESNDIFKANFTGCKGIFMHPLMNEE